MEGQVEMWEQNADVPRRDKLWEGVGQVEKFWQSSDVVYTVGHLWVGGRMGR